MQNYLDKLKTLDDVAIRALLMIMRTQIRILGSEVVIQKYDQEGEYREALGSMFQTDNPLTSPSEMKTDRVIINRNMFSDTHMKAGDPTQIYHYKNILDVGDTVTFHQGPYRYTFKVENKFSFGLKPDVLFRFDMIGLSEDDNGNI